MQLVSTPYKHHNHVEHKEIVSESRAKFNVEIGLMSQYSATGSSRPFRVACSNAALLSVSKASQYQPKTRKNSRKTKEKWPID